MRAKIITVIENNLLVSVDWARQWNDGILKDNGKDHLQCICELTQGT